MALDERVLRDLERAARPADPTGVYEHLIRRRERRRIARRVQAGGLALVVFAATIGGFLVLNRIFREADQGRDVAAPPPSNGLIVFSLPLEGEGEALMAVATDGSGLRRLTPEGRANYRSPDVSPDGRTIVVVHEIPSFEPGRSVLATVPIEGASPTWLSEKPGVVVDPTWSPDGDRIAFAGSIGGPYGIYVLEIATGEVDLVPGTDEISVGDPTWSPDGTRIAFEASTDSDTDPDQKNWDIYSARLDGSELVNLTNTPGRSETWPAWSWAVDRIVFVRGGGSRGGLYTMAPDGTDTVLVTDRLPTPASPAWSPDGLELAFSADTGQVYTIGSDGTDLRPVTGALGEPAWQALPESLPEGVTIAPPEQTASPSPWSARDIGLGFAVCNVSSIDAGFLQPDAPVTAYVATRRGDVGGCPQPEDAFNVVALDTDGDARSDVSYGPIDCTHECRAFSTPDVDGDGTAELLVVQHGGAVVGLGLYDVGLQGGAPTISPVNVAPPGDARGGFEPGEHAILWLGGDAFELYTLRCGDPDMRHGPGLIATAAESLPHDSPDARWHAHSVTFAMVDGSLRVMDVGDFTEPAGIDPPSFQSDETLCGSNLGP